MFESASSVSGAARTSLLIFTVIAALFAASCGSSAPLAITLVSSAGQSLASGQSTNITASVANDSTGKGVAWSLSPSTGAGTLSGSTTTSVTYTAPAAIPSAATVTITATSIANSAKSVAFTINLLPVSISLAPTSPQTLEQGMKVSPITATVSNDPANKGVTWSLSGAGALSGQTATTVVYTAPAGITAASTATVTATSVTDTTKTAPFTINLVPPPSVTTTAPSAGTVGVAYSTSLAATGGVSPYTWSVTAGALPGGLTLSGSTIAGTPTALGTFNFTVQVKDADNVTATANLSIKINPAPVSITTTSLPNGIANASYSATLQATGGAPPITWSVTAGSLPTGLVLNAATGAISGTPTTAGTTSFTVQAADSSTPALTNTKALSITVIPVLSITTSSLPNGITSTPYSATLQSAGGVTPITWTVSVGSLPAGLTLNASTGAISGTPTTAGTSSFTVQAADSGVPQQKVTKALSITVVQQLVVTNSSLPTGAVNSVYSATLQSSGGTPAVTWAITVGTLPAGLTLNAATGAITGTPTTAGMSGFTAQATDSGTPQQTATKQFNIIINPVLAVTTTSLPSGTIGTAYSQTLQTNGGGIAPITWSIVGSLPPGLSLAPNTGVISGTPTSATGSPFNFTVQAADSGTPQQTASKALSISIATAPLSVATTSLPNGVMGQAYSATLQSSGGNPPVTWSISVGSLPTWATLNATTGQITGTPNATGTTTFTVKATDSTTPTAQTATKQLSITVVAALSITSTLPNGVVGNPYNAPETATGGTTPYAWSWAAQSGSSLPPGLSINSSTGTISGTSGGSGGTFNVTVTVTDSTSPQQTASANFSITLTVATLTVTSTSGSLPAGTINTAYPNTSLNASGGIQPYTWSLSGGTTLPAGLSLSSSGQITGTPTAVGTTSFTVQVADSATPANTATASLSITVNAAPTCVSGGSESLLNGQYAFVLKGFDNGTGTGETSPQPALVGGVLTFNGSGGITAGAVDMNLNSGVQTNLSVTSGSYGAGSDHRGCMVITTSAGTQNYRFSLGNIASGVASTGHVINFDTTGPFTAGVLRKQTPAAFGTGASQVTGNYAFGVSSVQNIAACNGGTSCGGGFGAVGVFNFAAGVVTGGEVDFNQRGQLDGSSLNTNWPTSPIAINSGGSYTVSGTNGRGTVSFTPAATGATVVNAVIYTVSSTEVLVLSSDSQINNSAFAGELLKQSGTPFSATPLSGAYIGYQSGLSTTTAGTSRATLLLLNASGSGISGTQLRNDGGSFQSKSLTGITYSVASSGRMTVIGGTNPPIFYLVSSNQAFELSGDSSIDSGFFQSQTGTSASGAYAFGTIDPEDANSSDNSGVASFASTNINVTEDDNSNGSQNLGQMQSFTFSIDSTGLGVIPSGCSISVTPTTCQTVFYVISPTKAVVLDVATTNPKVQPADQ